MSVMPLRHVAVIRSSSVDKKSFDGELGVQLCNYMDVYRSDRVHPAPSLMRATATPEEVARFRLMAGDSVITKDSEDPTDIGVSAFVDGSANDFVCGYHLAIIRPRDAVSPRFLNWALRGREVMGHWSNQASGMTRYGLSLEGIKSAPIHVPALDQQRRIADFLDDRVARIDRIIAARRKQIERLEEERRSVSEHLVWEGLDPSEPTEPAIEPAMPSPKRWERLPNRYVLHEVANLSTTGDEELLSVSHLTGVTPRTEKSVTMFRAESLVGYKRVERNDLVINTLWAWMGALGISSVDGIVSPAYGVYRPIGAQRFHPPYFDEVYRSSAYVCEMTRHSKGVWSSRLRLYPDAFLALNVVRPPMDEQRQIASEIDKAVGSNAGRAGLLARSIDLLTEYKQSLITAAVTGELDVTTAGSGIPA